MSYQTAVGLAIALLFLLLPAESLGQRVPSIIGIFMDSETFAACGLSKLSEEELLQLDTWLFSWSGTILSESRDSSDDGREYDWLDFEELLGCWIIAADGQPLGVISTETYDNDSLMNSYGAYGSEYKSRSIFNSYGTYGSESSDKSPFNERAKNPPRIFGSDGEPLAYLTVNESIEGRVNPHELIAWLRSQ